MNLYAYATGDFQRALNEFFRTRSTIGGKAILFTTFQLRAKMRLVAGAGP